MSTSPTITLSFPEPDVALLTFDMPDKGVNILSASVLDELETHLDELDGRDELAGLVINSGKPGTFIAGADVREFVAGLDGSDEMAVQSSRRGQLLFARLSSTAYVTVAAVDGVCLGGGAELALWCDRRVLSDNPGTQIGQPEVKLGLLPGWGGTVRIPRIVGLGNAVEIITVGDGLSAADACQMGLVDDVTSLEQLLPAAIAMIREQQQTEVYLADREQRRLPLVMNETELGFLGVTASAMIQQQSGGHYPAPQVMLNLVLETAGCDEQQALEKEAEAVAGLFGSEVNRALLNIFFLQDRVKKYRGVSDDELTAQPIESAGVIGAGIMGSGIAAANVKRGIAVTVTDNSREALAAGARMILKEASYNKQIRSEDVKRALDLSPLIQLADDTSDYAPCQLVIEAIIERADIKQPLLNELDQVLPAESVLASNTSTIPISQLAEGLQHPERFCGIHFFNPVRQMKLVEVIRGEKTSDQTVLTAVQYVKQLGKLPVVINDGPGFLVNRLLFPYLNEAIQVVLEGASLRAVDKAARRFGMPMGPITLYDVVGIDTAVLAGRTMTTAFPDRAENIPLLEEMAEQKRLGQKTGAGFYQYRPGKKRGLDDPQVETLLAKHRSGDRSFEPDELVARMMVPMVVEATRALADGIVRDVQDLDLAMILGIGFPPFLGGPLFWADSLGPEKLAAMLEPLAELGPRYEITPLLADVLAGKRTFYDG